MERRALIALALSFLVFMAFIYYGEKTKPLMAPSPVTQTPAAPRRPRPRRRSRPLDGRGASHRAGEAAIDPSGQRRGGGHPLV